MDADAVVTSDVDEVAAIDSDCGVELANKRIRLWYNGQKATRNRRKNQDTIPLNASREPISYGKDASGAQPLRRNLRTRKLAQLHPYTVEALQYRRELYQNDWQDAVVSQREWRHARRLEAERAAATGGSALALCDYGNDADSEFSADEVVSGSPSLGARSSDQEDHAESPIASPTLSPTASTDSRNTPQRSSRQRRRRRSEPESSSSTSASSSSSKTSRSAKKTSVYAGLHDEAKEHQLQSSRSHPTLPDSDSSSGDSTDYERRFRILRRMMPAHMARACIDDLRAMRHGHAMSGEDSGATSPPLRTHTEAVTHHSDSPLRPGESRRRRGAQLSPHGPLLSDVDSSSETQSNVPSPLSPSRYEERDLRSWYKPQDSQEDTHIIHETDAVDRMLSRTTGSRGFGQRGAKKPLSRAKEGKVRSKNVAQYDSAWLWKPFRGATDSREELSGYISKTSRPVKQSVPAANGPTLLSSPSSCTSPRRSKPASKSQAKSPSLFVVQGNNNSHTNFPTSRGDLRSNARLPYSPKAGDDEINVLNSASLVHFPQKHLTMIPRSVPRRSKSIFSDACRQLPGANIIPSADQSQPIPVLSPNAASFKAKPIAEPSPEQITRRTIAKQPIPSYTAPVAEVPLSWQQATEESPELRDDLQHLLAFEKIRTISLDFDLKLPLPGSHFTSSSQIARGRLHALLRVDRDIQRETAPSCHLYGVTLRGWLTLNELQEALPPLLDDVWDSLQDSRQDEASPPSPSDPRTTSEAAQQTSLARVDDLLFFLTEWLSWQVSQPIQLADLSRDVGNTLLGEPTKSNIDAAAYGTRLVDLVYTSLDRESDHDAAQLAELRLCLLWFRVAIAYRVYSITNEIGTDLGVIEAAQPLMVHLLARGIHKTMASVCASQSDEINDRCAELWIGLIYVLDSVDHSFYDVLDAALDDWQVNAPVSPLIASERVWYMIFAMSVLARFGAAAGVVRSSAAMPSSWMLIHRALSLQLRFDSRVEAAAPRALLRRRDAYLRTVLARCLLLVDRFAWSLHDADVVLGRLFDWLDTHKLGDLPTETDHDFAPFLRRYNLALLYEGPSGNAFQRFLQLLARVGKHLFEHDKQRQLARIFSRMTPVRIMPFSREYPPTSAERAMLFNHYSLVMLFLHFVPQSALQRLRQIRSFLDFPSADRISQITCIRAMVYCGTLFRHHNLCLAPIIAWFVEVCRASTKEVRMIPDRDDRRAVHRQKESVRVLLGVVRGVQHLVQHSSLNANHCRQFPPPELLHAAWTDELLGIDGVIDAEVIQGLNAFLQQRAEIRLSVFQHTSSTYAMDVDFDDADTMEDEALWADPQLAALLGETEAASATSAALVLEWDKDADRKLADTLHTRISPALFKRIAQPWPVPIAPGAFHQQGQVEALVANAERDANFHLLVSCWVACAEVLVQNEVRSWGSYLTLGTESWKRLPDAKQKRDVALQFSVLLAEMHPEGFRSEIWEVTGIWFQCIMAPQLSQQVHLTMQLIKFNPGHLFDSVTFSAEPQVTASLSRQTIGKESFATAYDPIAKEFAKNRSRCLWQVLENMNRIVSQAEPPFSLGFAIQCISALLSSLRAYAPIPNDEMYRKDVEKVFQQLSSMHAPLDRGISTELQSTMAVV
ncbi:hypothetical protein MYAM1_002739 [Malassezia yamatoensis]|uniref:Uncharacterized protein n=1 Tax=Malassezia yamatoensis TaxID=253288 RepID=A0AAJ5YUG7_9BASI|nr:hypothetical protein MYAM1_002739 [Malassezia yamatoensis]